MVADDDELADFSTIQGMPNIGGYSGGGAGNTIGINAVQPTWTYLTSTTNASPAASFTASSLVSNT